MKASDSHHFSLSRFEKPQGTRKSPKIPKEKFTKEEDQKLKDLVKKYGNDNWQLISSFVEGRSARQCRDRWNHYIGNENLKHDNWTKEEDDLLLYWYEEVGSRWAVIAKHFPNRNSVIIRNRCGQILRKYRKMKTAKEQNKKHFDVSDAHRLEIKEHPKTVEVSKKKIILPSCKLLPFCEGMYSEIAQAQTDNFMRKVPLF